MSDSIQFIYRIYIQYLYDTYLWDNPKDHVISLKVKNSKMCKYWEFFFFHFTQIPSSIVIPKR